MKEWALSLRSAHKLSQELLGSMARKAGKIYGTERDASSKSAMVNSNSGGNTNIGNSGVGIGGGSTTSIGGSISNILSSTTTSSSTTATSTTNVQSKSTNGSN